MADVFKLPASSYEELIKIIKAYGTGKVGVSMSLDDLVKSSGMGRTIISKNNGFLVQVGLVTDGNKKSPTEACKKLASAYASGFNENTSLVWRELCEKDEFINRMVSMVGIRGSVTKSELTNHIIDSANCGNGPGHRAGAVALVEIMKTMGLIEEDEGKIGICDTRPKDSDNTVELDMVSSPVQSSGTVEKEEERENTFYVQQYTCESGKIAKIILPEDATEDDLLGFRDMLNIALKRKFKIKME